MGKKLAISAEKCAQDVSLTTMNLSEREIFRQAKISKIAVHNATKKFQNEGTFKLGYLIGPLLHYYTTCTC